jgi:hypothetical protein
MNQFVWGVNYHVLILGRRFKTVIYLVKISKTIPIPSVSIKLLKFHM